MVRLISKILQDQALIFINAEDNSSGSISVSRLPVSGAGQIPQR
jgi:hypothetical protein